MRQRTAREWATYWRNRCEAAEGREAVLLESAATYLHAWARFEFHSEFRDQFFEEHYDAILVDALRDLESKVAASEGRGEP